MDPSVTPLNVSELLSSLYTMYSAERGLLYCQNGKTGSTSFTRVLLHNLPDRKFEIKLRLQTKVECKFYASRREICAKDGKNAHQR